MSLTTVNRMCKIQLFEFARNSSISTIWTRWVELATIDTDKCTYQVRMGLNWQIKWFTMPSQRYLCIECSPCPTHTYVVHCGSIDTSIYGQFHRKRDKVNLKKSKKNDGDENTMNGLFIDWLELLRSIPSGFFYFPLLLLFLMFLLLSFDSSHCHQIHWENVYRTKQRTKIADIPVRSR